MIAVLMWAIAATPCHPVSGSQILGRDLAAAFAAFSGIRPDAVIGYAPQPGTRRLFDSGELARIAHANGLDDSGLLPLCFERAAAALDATQVGAAMRQSLGTMDAQLEIIELSRYPAPRGRIVFPRESLGAPSTAGIAIWRGFVQFEGGRIPIWARIRLAVRENQVIAAVNLKPGQTIKPGDIQLQEGAGFPQGTRPLTSIEAVLGRTTRRAIPAGSLVYASSLDENYEINPGEVAFVEVRSGGAVLRLEARAEAAGHRGETVTFRSSASGKPFRARVTGHDRALIEFPRMEVSQ